MKKQIIYKIIFIFLILLCLATTIVYAENYGSLNQFDPYTTEGSSFYVVDNAINRTLGVVLNVIRIALFCIGLAILIIIGIQYMIHSAEPHFNAELKKNLPFYLMGVVILFGASGILQVVTYLVNDIF